jgi:ParB/RepB/Spo0J family partition protein
VVRFNPAKPGRYTLIGGERRLRACQLLKQARIVARVVRESNDLDAAKKRLVENDQREDLTPIEEARGFRELSVEHKVSQEEIGKLAGGKSQSYVANALRLLELPGPVQQFIQAGALTRAHGVALVRYAKSSKVCVRMAELAIAGDDRSKDLEGRDVPYAYQLAKEKLIVEVNPYEYGRPDYVVPAALKSDPAFIGDYCFEPEKWAPEKARQDAEFAKRAKAQERAEGTRQSKMSPAQKAERKKKIASNKKNRIDSAAATQAAHAHLKAAKTIERGTVAAVVSKLFTDGHYAFVLKEAAKQIGLTIPSGLVTNSYRSWVSVPKLLTLSEVDMLRLAAASIVQYHGAEAVKYSHQPPDEVTAIVPKGRKGKAK